MLLLLNHSFHAEVVEEALAATMGQLGAQAAQHCSTQRVPTPPRLPLECPSSMAGAARFVPGRRRFRARTAGRGLRRWEREQGRTCPLGPSKSGTGSNARVGASGLLGSATLPWDNWTSSGKGANELFYAPRAGSKLRPTRLQPRSAFSQGAGAAGPCAASGLAMCRRSRRLGRRVVGSLNLPWASGL